MEELFLLICYRPRYIWLLEVLCTVLEKNEVIEITVDRFISERILFIKIVIFREN